MRLARHLHALVQEHPDFEAMTQHLSITTFRYVPERVRTAGPISTVKQTPEVEEYLTRLNQELLKRVEQSGEAFLSNAMVRGRFALRACVVNFRTSLSDIDAVVSLLSRLGKGADER
jgi:glutamate/tyrosine decarboxylase-like PLP-dependent enzyme